jgi:hypothetical protein
LLWNEFVNGGGKLHAPSAFFHDLALFGIGGAGVYLFCSEGGFPLAEVFASSLIVGYVSDSSDDRYDGILLCHGFTVLENENRKGEGAGEGTLRKMQEDAGKRRNSW